MRAELLPSAWLLNGRPSGLFGIQLKWWGLLLLLVVVLSLLWRWWHTRKR